MNIYDALKAIVEVQKSISISTPTPVAVQNAYLTSPPQNVTPSMFPYWTNSWDFVREDRQSNTLRHMTYLVEMRLHVGRATTGDNSVLAERATAFLDAVLTAFGSVNAAGLGGVTMKGMVSGAIQPTVSSQNIRGGVPTLALMGEGEARTIGLQLVCEIELFDAFVYS